MITLTDFLLARIAEDEAVAREATAGRWHVDDIYRTVTADPFTSARQAYDRAGDEDCWVISESMDSGVGRHNLAHIARHDPARVLAECEAKRQIVEWHKSWPVLVQRPPTFEPVADADPNRFAVRASQQIAWATEQEYRDRFGDEPPTGPVLAALAAVYAGHPDYREEWRP